MPAPPLSVRDAATVRALQRVPAVADRLPQRVPAQVGVDRLLVHLVRRRDHDRTVRRRLVVVKALVVDGDAEEAGRAERDVRRMLLLDRAADAFFALVDAEHELRSRPALDRVRTAARGAPPSRPESCGGRCARRRSGRRGAARGRCRPRTPATAGPVPRPRAPRPSAASTGRRVPSPTGSKHRAPQAAARARSATRAQHLPAAVEAGARGRRAAPRGVSSSSRTAMKSASDVGGPPGWSLGLRSSRANIPAQPGRPSAVANR